MTTGERNEGESAKESIKDEAKSLAKQQIKQALKKIGQQIGQAIMKFLAANPEAVAAILAVIVVIIIIVFIALLIMSWDSKTSFNNEGVLDVYYMNQFRDDPISCFAGSRWDAYSTSASGNANACGGTSQAMVERFIKGDETTVDTIFHRRNKGSNAFNNSDLNNQIRSKGVQYKMITFSGGENPSPEETEKALKDIEASIKIGYPGVIRVKPPFAASMHVMVVTGFNEFGEVYINDPNCGRGAPPFLGLGEIAGKNNRANREDLKKALRYAYSFVED